MRRTPFRDGLATTGEAAIVLGGIHDRTVSNLIRRGQLAGIRVCGEGQYRIPVAALAAFAATWRPQPHKNRRPRERCQIPFGSVRRRCGCRACRQRVLDAWYRLTGRQAA